MTRLPESTVQNVAQAFLEKKYKSKAKGKMFGRIEVRTRKKYGAKRADGFIAFKRWYGSVNVVSMEAKSYKTLHNLRPRLKYSMILLNSLWFGLLFIIGSGSIFFWWKSEGGLYDALFPVSMFVMGACSYALWSYNSYKHHHMEVIDQLGRYPANWQWLAFSQDSYNHIKEHDRQNIRRISRSHGYGLLLVDANKKVVTVLRPRRKSKYFGDYLRFYSIEDEVRKFLK